MNKFIILLISVISISSNLLADTIKTTDSKNPMDKIDNSIENTSANHTSIEEKNYLKDLDLSKEKDKAFKYAKIGAFTIAAYGVGIGYRNRYKELSAVDYSFALFSCPYAIQLSIAASLKASLIRYHTKNPTSFYTGAGFEGIILSMQTIPIPNIEILFGKEFHSNTTNRKQFTQLGINLTPILIAAVGSGEYIKNPLIKVGVAGAAGLLTMTLSYGISF